MVRCLRPRANAGCDREALNAEIAKVLADPESRDRMTAQGLEPTAMTPAEVRRYTQEETKRWARLIKAAGIQQTQIN